MHEVALTIPDAAKAANISRSSLYEEIRHQRLRAVKIGRSTRIRIEDLRAWIDSRPPLAPLNKQPRYRSRRTKT
jgi:excisionase family DNA binding protein